MPCRLAPLWRVLGVSGALLPAVAWADPAGEVREAVGVLARTSYGWETTGRQRFKGESAEPRLDAKAPLELQGWTDPNGTTQITLAPSRDLPVSITAVSRRGIVVAHTPSGWLLRSELRPADRTDRPVEFEGKQVRPSRVVTAALKVTTMRPLAEDLLDLVADVKSWRSESGLIVAELRDATIEKLWGDAQAKRAPEVHGTVIFKMGPQGLAEFHVVIGIGFPNTRTKTVAWSTQQWSTRVTGIGSTTVDPPEAALRALEK